MKILDNNITIDKFDIQRRVVAYATGSAWRNIPHASIIYEPDITELYSEFSTLRLIAKKNKNINITFNTLVIKIISEALKKSPKLNALLNYNNLTKMGTLHICSNINIMIPYLLPDGKMITPVITNTADKSLCQLSLDIEELHNKIKNTNIDELLYKTALVESINEIKHFRLPSVLNILGASIGLCYTKYVQSKIHEDKYKAQTLEHLTPSNLLSGTVLVSNIGSIYSSQRGTFALLEIIPPQVLAVGIGAIQRKPGIYKINNGTEQIGIRYYLPICIAFDHRAVDYTPLIPFQKAIDDICNNPKVIKNWL